MDEQTKRAIIIGVSIAVLGGGVGVPAVKSLGKFLSKFWSWFTKPMTIDQRRHAPYWLYRFRWWYNSTNEYPITLSQWVHRNVLCRLRGHHFPRGLRNDAGRWNIADTWYGNCQRCDGLVTASSSDKLDEFEKRGVRPHSRTRRPIRREKKSG
jgi:hypothetical protein